MELLSDGGVYIETAHRLTNLGAVVTWAGHGTSQEGSDVEFRGINVLTVEGDLINRCEIFDEADLDAALASFEELQPQPRRLENAASQVAERFLAHFAAATGRPWRRCWPTTFPETIAAGGGRGSPRRSRCLA